MSQALKIFDSITLDEAALDAALAAHEAAPTEETWQRYETLRNEYDDATMRRCDAAEALRKEYCESQVTAQADLQKSFDEYDVIERNNRDRLIAAGVDSSKYVKYVPKLIKTSSGTNYMLPRIKLQDMGSMNEDFDRDVKTFAVLKTHQNVVIALRKLGGYAEHDELSDKIIIRGFKSEHLDDAVQLVMVESDTQFKVLFKKEMVINAIEHAARKSSFHPVRDYLTALEWDNVPRLDKMLSVYFGVADTALSSVISSKWMISAVARAMEPGCKADYMLILEGKQGIKKSTALEMLFGKNWTNATHQPIDHKDALSALLGNWLRVFEECDSLNKKDAALVKSFLTNVTDKYRPPYGRVERVFPRQCVFAGTTNKGEYLSDDTGARRFWPVLCDRIDLFGLRDMRDQLWAEAVSRYNAGEQWWTEDEEVLKQLDSEQSARHATNDTPLYERVSDMLTYQEGRISAITIIDSLRSRGAQIRQSEEHSIKTQIGIIMKRIGWDKKKNARDNTWFWQKGSGAEWIGVRDLALREREDAVSAPRNF